MRIVTLLLPLAIVIGNLGLCVPVPAAAADCSAAATRVQLAADAAKDRAAYNQEGDSEKANIESSNIEHLLDVAGSDIGACRNRSLLTKYYTLLIPYLSEKLDLGGIGVKWRASDVSSDTAAASIPDVDDGKAEYAKTVREVWQQVHACRLAGVSGMVTDYGRVKADLRSAFQTLSWSWVSPDVDGPVASAVFR